MKARPSHRLSAAMPCAFAALTSGTAGAACTAGFYLGGGVGQANYDIDYSSQVNAAYAGSAFNVISSSMARGHDFAGNVYGGYQFVIPLAIELGYVNLGEPRRICGVPI